MRSRILFLPECPDRDAFVDVLARTAFHLAYLEPETLTFVVAPGLRQSAERVVQDTIVPDGFDAVTEEHIRRVSGRVVIVETGTPEAERLGDDSDIIAVWDSVRFAEGPWAYEAGRRDPFRTIFNVDPRTNRLEASEYAMLGHKVAAPPVGAEESRFHTMLRDLGPAGDVYLFGTGPSIAEAADRPFESGVRIVANTVILDRDLMAHIQPQIVTYADPIFHFGPSRYAARFRSELRRALAGDPGLRTIIPFRYRAFLADLMPEHADRIIGVPQLGASAPLVLDLTEQFGVKSFPNILTMLMIPLAATVGHRIGLIGFDGRQPGESYFWKHGAKVQLHDELPAIRKIHPGFFVVDYEDYYATHLTTVEHLFQSCEAAGIVVQSLSGSFMPPTSREASETAFSPRSNGGSPEADCTAAAQAHVSLSASGDADTTKGASHSQLNQVRRSFLRAESGDALAGGGDLYLGCTRKTMPVLLSRSRLVGYSSCPLGEPECRNGAPDDRARHRRETGSLPLRPAPCSLPPIPTATSW